jgi:hypothetical protein
MGNMSRVSSVPDVPLDEWRDVVPAAHLLATGADGSPGPQGPQGMAGVGLSVHAPVADQAARLALVPGLPDDTLVLQLDTGEAWTWTGGRWVDSGHLVGPQGAPGVKGDLGPPGAKGDKGDPGAVIAMGSSVVTVGAFGSLDFSHAFPAGKFKTAPVVTVSNGDYTANQAHVELLSITTAGFMAIATAITGPAAQWLENAVAYTDSVAFAGENTSDDGNHMHIIIANTDPSNKAGVVDHNHHMNVSTDPGTDARKTHHHMSKGHLTKGTRPTNLGSSIIGKPIRVNWIAVRGT